MGVHMTWLDCKRISQAHESLTHIVKFYVVYVFLFIQFWRPLGVFSVNTDTACS